MIAYSMVGVRDLARAAAFYDPLFDALGKARQFTADEAIAWGTEDERAPRFIACLPFDGEPAAAGNGTMTAFLIEDTATIDRLHALALDLGGTDEGAPGKRPRYGKSFYSGYVRDPDGNKIAFVNFEASLDA